jgi:phage tail protein X
MNQTETVKREGMTLAALIWQVMGSQPESFVETVLTANPGLSSLGPVLPVGTKVVLPLDQVRTEQPEEQAVRLWD